MTRAEFLKVAVYIEVGIGKALTADAKDVYFDCLGDLSAEVMALAAKRVLMEHKWANFPSIAELREAAAETQRGQVKELSPAEAWAIAWKIAASTDPEVDGSFARAAKNAPPLVLEAVRAFGLLDLCYSKDPIGVMRGQFLKIFEQLAARDRRRALLPATLTKAIEEHPDRRVAPVRKALAGIGMSVNETEGTK